MMQDVGLESNYPVLSHPCLIQGMLPVNHHIMLCCKGVDLAPEGFHQSGFTFSGAAAGSVVDLLLEAGINTGEAGLGLEVLRIDVDDQGFRY